MKILHTSDWHLGQHFYGQSRKAEHQQFLDWLIDIAIENRVDVIIVAGDVFDIGSPPSYARALYYQFIVKLQSSGIHVVVVAGNHDSAATLTESKDLLACLNTDVIPGVMSNPEEQVIVVHDQSGKKPQAIICAIPFLRPKEVQLSAAGQNGKDKQLELQQAIADHYQQIYQLALKKLSQCESPLPIIATGHLATIGAKVSDSVRDIYIGTLSAFSAEHFPPVDYMALGHIHRYQRVSENKPFYYCGSPIALSFDEVGQQKMVLMANFEGPQLKEVCKITVPCFQRLFQISGDLPTIEERIDELHKKYTDESSIWLEIIVKTSDYLGDLQQKIQAMIKDKPFLVLKIQRYKPSEAAHITADTQQTLQELTPEEIFEKRLLGEQWQGDEQKTLLKKLRLAFADIVSELDHS